MSNFLTVTLILLLFLTGFSVRAQQVWTVDQCIEQGWQTNLSVRQSEFNKVNAQYDLEQSKAGFHPSLNASYTNGYNWGRSIDPTSYQFVHGLVNTNNISLTGNITVFDGFITPNRVKQSKVGVQLADAQLEQQKNFIAMNIASAYLQTLLAYENIGLISNQLAASRELFYITKKYLTQGLKSEWEVLQIKSQIAKESSDSVQAVNTLRLAKLTLTQLMNIPYSDDFEIERFDPRFTAYDAVLPNSEVIYDSAVTVLPEIKNANLNIAYNELELKARKGSYYPNLALTGRLGSTYASSSKNISQQISYEEQPLGYLASDPTQTVIVAIPSYANVASPYPYFDQLNNNLTGTVSIVLSVPIYNKKQVKVSAEKAEVNVNKAKLDLRNQENILQKDIESDYLQFQLLNDQLKASREKLTYLQESYKKMLKQYDLQLSNSYELMLEKNKILASESEIAQLQYQRLFKIIILQYYQSGNVELPMR